MTALYRCHFIPANRTRSNMTWSGTTIPYQNLVWMLIALQRNIFLRSVGVLRRSRSWVKARHPQWCHRSIRGCSSLDVFVTQIGLQQLPFALHCFRNCNWAQKRIFTGDVTPASRSWSFFRADDHQETTIKGLFHSGCLPTLRKCSHALACVLIVLVKYNCTTPPEGGTRLKKGPIVHH